MGRLPDIGWYRRLSRGETDHYYATTTTTTSAANGDNVPAERHLVEQIGDHYYVPVLIGSSSSIPSTTNNNNNDTNTNNNNNNAQQQQQHQLQPTAATIDDSVVFVASQVEIIFNNLTDQSFTLIKTLQLDQYDLINSIQQQHQQHQPSKRVHQRTRASEYSWIRDYANSDQKTTIYACLVKADSRRAHAEVGVRLLERKSKWTPVKNALVAAAVAASATGSRLITSSATTTTTTTSNNRESQFSVTGQPKLERIGKKATMSNATNHHHHNITKVIEFIDAITHSHNRISIPSSYDDDTTTTITSGNSHANATNNYVGRNLNEKDVAIKSMITENNDQTAIGNGWQLKQLFDTPNPLLSSPTQEATTTINYDRSIQNFIPDTVYIYRNGDNSKRASVSIEDSNIFGASNVKERGQYTNRLATDSLRQDLIQCKLTNGHSITD